MSLNRAAEVRELVDKRNRYAGDGVADHFLDATPQASQALEVCGYLLSLPRNPRRLGLVVLWLGWMVHCVSHITRPQPADRAYG